METYPSGDWDVYLDAGFNNPSPGDAVLTSDGGYVGMFKAFGVFHVDGRSSVIRAPPSDRTRKFACEFRCPAALQSLFGMASNGHSSAR
jgi:hypothetical protein